MTPLLTHHGKAKKNNQSPASAGEKGGPMEQLTIASLDQARTMINGAHHKAMTSFIELDYIFRQVGDNKLYEQGGYTSLAEFAKEEYNYSQSQVSRFISLNLEFSVEGNTPILAEKYE